MPDLTEINLPASKLVKNQTRQIHETRGDKKLVINIRFDDQCGNGHNTFAITGELRERDEQGRWRESSFGCTHDVIGELRPDLQKYFKWHLTSTDGPMHYISNAKYMASDKDCWGKRKGEEKDFRTSIFFDKVPIPFNSYSEKFVSFLQKNDPSLLEIVKIEHKPDPSYKWNPKFTFEGFGSEWWHCPFDSESEAKNFLKALQTCEVKFDKVCVGWGEGKEPDLEAARSAAIWPDATLEDFTDEKLLLRLPSLMEEFKKAMEELGFNY